jgi:GT2 family glycosyltransferase
MNAIRVVVASKLKQDEFLYKSATGRSIDKFINTSNVHVLLFSENETGLSELYNKAIEDVIDDDLIIVFMHDDVLIADFYWADKVRAGLEVFDVVGVAGNTRRMPNQPGWILNTDMKLDHQKYLSGAIGQGYSFPPEVMDVFGPIGRECKLMDGVFLATTSAGLKRSGLRFDTRFGFHFYDLDFCRSAETLGMRMGTIPLSLVHQSYGQIDKSWEESYKTYIQKWGS